MHHHGTHCEKRGVLLPIYRALGPCVSSAHAGACSVPPESQYLPLPVERRCGLFFLKISTILRGVTQQRRGVISVESYYQHLLNPQALQFDSRDDDLDKLYFSDYDTGYIYKVTGVGGRGNAVIAAAATVVVKEGRHAAVKHVVWKRSRPLTD